MSVLGLIVDPPQEEHPDQVQESEQADREQRRQERAALVNSYENPLGSRTVSE